mmetsp:Transcript_25144/g.68344  ORF Transcript_25144/g.68344 Transcript_25144/m.68344 type:complete len:85 (-) Transcript_25144:1387-1641(-)
MPQQTMELSHTLLGTNSPILASSVKQSPSSIHQLCEAQTRLLSKAWRCTLWTEHDGEMLARAPEVAALAKLKQIQIQWHPHGMP